ncbi:serine protease [Amycolatopsis sp. A133]|uniref:trypsin-like serine peptidase n=1 Tax=Amycolatopsis sp. A133 TaxID=3064472 RepID=UPI0027EDCB31|nr:serine protease [Amycolatopsis sp. A133]MDQ7802715.1 serine protease [Amycolatopsis sp. A133]
MTSARRRFQAERTAASMFADPDAVAASARALADAERRIDESFDPNAPAVDELAAAVRVVRANVLEAGARGLEKTARDPDIELTPHEELGLEAIVLRFGRPALLVQHGDFTTDLPTGWEVLDDHRDAIGESIARVGRVEVDGHPDFEWLGTGFLVADDVLMTNRHVAMEFARRDGAEWSFRTGRSATWDVLEESGFPGQREFAIQGIIGVHDADLVDLALLRVEPIGDLPAPVTLATTAPDDLIDRKVYVVGYPAADGRRNDPADMSRIFADIYNVKRLQPGTLTATADPNVLLHHDCSTLGGNSGSPVFDLETHHVVGLHFGGKYLAGNNAVPIWSLTGDPLVAKADLNYA